jgi:hypothetical protein
MRQWTIQEDKLYDQGIETSRLGKFKETYKSPFLSLNKNKEFIFPFTCTAHSLGDWGIINRLPECIKKIYPNSKIYIPSPLLIKDIFSFLFSMGQWSNHIKTPWEVGSIILKNNPFIDGIYEKGELEGECFTDHYRIYSNKNDDNEPLVEQLLRAFGASENQILEFDSRPKIYLSDKEEEWYKNFKNQHFGNDYGCLLLASSRIQLNKQWDFDSNLFPHIEKYKDYPVFYYSSFDISKSSWATKFKKFISFEKIGLSFREQLIVKQKAIFNTGYQAGITDAISGGGSEIITLTPYKSIGQNVIRKTKYIFPNKEIKIY